METAKRKPGARPQFADMQKFNTNLPSSYRERLESYADQEHISIAEALRRAIDALLLPEKTTK